MITANTLALSDCLQLLWVTAINISIHPSILEFKCGLIQNTFYPYNPNPYNLKSHFILSFSIFFFTLHCAHPSSFSPSQERPLLHS